MNAITMSVAVFLAGAAVAVATLIVFQRRARARGAETAERNARTVIQKAEEAAAATVEAANLEARLLLETAESKVEEDNRRRLLDIEEKRLDVERRDKDLKRRIAYADEKMKQIQEKESAVATEMELASTARREAETLVAEHRSRLEHIAGYTLEEAREELRKEMELDARREASAFIVRAREEARERAEAEARWITAEAMQRIPLSQYAESTVTVVSLPGDDMKGRIIGREGRNIRAIEMGCGIDLLIDDTPGVITLSSFDPTRRMVAKMAIDKLVEDGRIHPARIEEVIAKVKEDLDKMTVDQGETAAFELGLHEVNPRLMRMAGRLQFVTYHGQTVLAHSREVALLASQMADSIGVRAEVAKRAGFLHKIAFGDESLKDRSPLTASAEIAQRLGEIDEVVHCIQALYGLVAPRSVEAVLLQVAEEACVARPGARKEMLESHLQELKRIETIATSFQGVREAHAVRAGKEVRVIVSAEKVSDKEAIWLSKDIAGRIEKEIKYPGQLRVSVIRETRSVGFAM